MASNSKAFLIMIIFAVAIASTPTSATDYLVGDAEGWTIGTNFTAWADGKWFYVGDTLVFKYPVGDHNVYKVNGTAFQKCLVPPPSEALTTGNDVITLASPGRKWYISGVGNGTDCNYGMKLAIDVYPAWMPPTSAPSPSPAYGYNKKPMSFWKLNFHF